MSQIKIFFFKWKKNILEEATDTLQMSSWCPIHLAVIIEKVITYIWTEFHSLPGIATLSFKAGVGDRIYCPNFADVGFT